MDLLNVKQIIVHGQKCPDGRASAMIAKAAFAAQGLNVRVDFMMYQTSEFEQLVPSEGMMFLDFSPHPPKADEFLAAKTIVLDHHRGRDDVTKHMVLRFQEQGLGIYADEETEPGVSGAVLTYRHVWVPLCGPNEDIERFARVAGIRDTWQKKDPLWIESCEQYKALEFWPEDVLLKASTHEWPNLTAIGGILWAKFQSTLKKVSEGSYRWTSNKGTKVAIFQGTKLSSDVAEYLDSSDVELVIAYDINYKPEEGTFKLGLSTRSHKGFNCRDFVGTFGGGGHTPAAGGAVTMDIETAPNPYKMIQDLLNGYEAA